MKDWLRITSKDSDGDLVELIIDLYQFHDDENSSTAANGKHHLFTVTVYIAEQKLKIYGDYKDLWGKNEFNKLKSFANELCLSSKLNAETISSLYTTSFRDTSDVYGSKEKLDLSNVSFDVLNDVDSSDCDEDVEGIEENLILKQPSTKSPKVRRRRSKALSSPRHNTTKIPPGACHRRKMERKSSVHSTLPTHSNGSINQKQIIDFIESISNRVNKLEQLMIKIDSTLATTDVDILDIQTETEIKRLQGRIGSLVEEKSQLLKRVAFLENSNAKLHEEITSNHTKPQDQQVNNHISQSETKPQEEKVPGAIDSTAAKASNKNNENQEQVQDQSPEYDFVILCDSNRKYINADQLYPKGNNKVIPCGNTAKAIDILTSPRFTVKHGIIINTGVNDLESLSPKDIIESQTCLVNIATTNFPDKKIIMSSITPRRDDLDKFVFEVNKAVAQNICKIPNVVLVDNGNLRSKDQFYFDTKHLSRRHGIPLFATNLKNGIRKSLGINNRRISGQHRFPYPKSNHGSSWSDVVKQNPPLNNSRNQSTISEVKNHLVDLTAMFKQFLQTTVNPSAQPPFHNYPAPQPNNLFPPSPPLFPPPFPPSGLVYGNPQFGT
ncbi:Hypothetical predicted protein [Paramuricea clavata]|uniref:Uncharacterized protein n=1 Tax=Paramuricea clavata TaxID=317549 RepID=A0A7D9IDN3_PARCT|nr:Hypothetical predicted protein [Paramuricea clavata]